MITSANLHDQRQSTAASHRDATGGPGRPMRASSLRALRRGWTGPALINVVAAVAYTSLTGGPTGVHVVAACIVAMVSAAIALVVPRSNPAAAGRDADVAALRALLLEARDTLAPRIEGRPVDRRLPRA